MSKKKSSKKKTARKTSKKVNVRKGKKAPFKTHGSRGIAASQAIANRKKRGKKKKGSRKGGFKGYSPAFPESSRPLFPSSTVVLPVPAGYTGALPGVRSSVLPKVALTPAARKRARKAAAAAAAASAPTVAQTEAIIADAVGKAVKAAKPAKKKAAKKTASNKRAAKKKTTSAAAAPSPKPRAGKRKKLGHTAPKLALMKKWGFPRGTKSAISGVRRSKLRQEAGAGVGAGGKVTFNDIMRTIKDEKLKSWVCVGPRRTGCGGGAKNLRGGHQIGVFRTMH